MNTARWKRSLILCMIMVAVIFQGLWLKAMEIPGEVLSPTSIITYDENLRYSKTSLASKASSPTDAAIQTKENTQPDAILQILLNPNTPEQEFNNLLDTLALLALQEKPAAPDEQAYALDDVLGITPLHQAVRENNEQKAHTLLEQGANPDEPAAHFSFTPRQMAANEPDTPTSQLVLSWPRTEQ